MSDPLLGRTLGNYKVLRKLGEGGMGAVYEAEHPGIGRRAAIKVLRAHLAGDPDTVARFFREARAVNQVRHANVVQVLDLGQTPEGVIYSIMELLEGESLSARLKRVRRLGIGQAVAIFDAVASALETVHAHGIVHRDLKPDNIFLAREGEREVVKVLDFGVAKLMAGQDANLSQTGAIIGTPAYMSPEQCEGHKEVNARTDVYAMGCVLYHMLAGVPPFLADSVTKMIMMHVSVPPPPAREHRPELPEVMEALIGQALAKRPDERLQSMRAFRNALRAAAAGVSETGVEPLPEIATIAPVFPASGGSGGGGGAGTTTLGGAIGEVGNSAARRRRAPLVIGAVVALVTAGVMAVWWVKRGKEKDGKQVVAQTETPAPTPTHPPTPTHAPTHAPTPMPTKTPAPTQGAVARGTVGAEKCKEVLGVAGKVMVGTTGAGTRPYRYFAKYGSDAETTKELDGICLGDFDDAVIACLGTVKEAMDVVRCSDEMLGRRCAAGNQRDCSGLAWKAVEEGDFVKAGELARSSCSAGVGQGCSALGVLLFYGRGEKVNLAGARANFMRGAAVNDPNATGYLGHFAEYGIGMAPDADAARERFATACTLDPGHSACARVAFFEAAGLGGSRDRTAAAAHAKAACDDEVPDGCRFLAEHAEGAEQTELWLRAARLYEERAPVLPMYRLRLGELRLAGHGVAKDAQAGAADIAAACEGNEPAACEVLGRLHVSGAIEVNVARARSANQKACGAGLPAACAAAACQELLDPSKPAPAAAALDKCKKAGHLGPVQKSKSLRKTIRSAPKGPRRDHDNLLMD